MWIDACSRIDTLQARVLDRQALPLGRIRGTPALRTHSLIIGLQHLREIQELPNPE
jgi:hypothetical protein